MSLYLCWPHSCFFELSVLLAFIFSYEVWFVQPKLIFSFYREIFHLKLSFWSLLCLGQAGIATDLFYRSRFFEGDGVAMSGPPPKSSHIMPLLRGPTRKEKSYEWFLPASCFAHSSSFSLRGAPTSATKLFWELMQGSDLLGCSLSLRTAPPSSVTKFRRHPTSWYPLLGSLLLPPLTQQFSHPS